MNKYKYLAKNISLLTISSFGTKILSFILIPIYTNYLSTAEYGTFDVYSTTVSLFIPILTLNIIESVMRFSLDEKIKKTDIFTIGINYIIQSIIIFTILFTINKIFNIINIFSEYYIFLILLFISEIIYNLLTQFSRGLEKIKEIAISGAINSIVMLLLNVILLVKFELGIRGYFISYIVSYTIPSIYLTFKLKIYQYVKIKKTKSRASVHKEMIEYSKPLIFNTIGWWVNNVSDRYIVTWMCGVDENGVYSIAYKIPSILNILQLIFSQAWTLSAVKEIKNKNKDFYLKIYKIYNFSFIMVCSVLIIFDKLIAKILFSNDFYNAWKYAPILMISVVFGSLSGMLGGIFSAVKESKVLARTTIIGSFSNLLLNLILVFFIGPMGAAIATLISYAIVWFLRLRETKKIVNMDINLKRDVYIYILLVVQAVLLFVKINKIGIYIIEGLIFIGITILLRDELLMITNKGREFVMKKIGVKR